MIHICFCLRTSSPGHQLSDNHLREKGRGESSLFLHVWGEERSVGQTMPCDQWSLQLLCRSQSEGIPHPRSHSSFSMVSLATRLFQIKLSLSFFSSDGRKEHHYIFRYYSEPSNNSGQAFKCVLVLTCSQRFNDHWSITLFSFWITQLFDDLSIVSKMWWMSFLLLKLFATDFQANFLFSLSESSDKGNKCLLDRSMRVLWTPHQFMEKVGRPKSGS